MKEIIINKNRNYFKPVIIIILMICTLYVLIFKFLRNPAEHIYFLLRTKEIVVIFSIIGIVSCLLITYIIIKNLFKKNNFLKINRQGIYNGFFFYDNKFIKWSEVDRIETIRHNYNNYIAIFVKKTSNKEKGINHLLYKLNELTMGTPYIIYSGDLDCSFKKLEETINIFLKKIKNNSIL